MRSLSGPAAFDHVRDVVLPGVYMLAYPLSVYVPIQVLAAATDFPTSLAWFSSWHADERF